MNSTKRIIIFTGGSLGDWALQLIEPGDYLIGADGGALFLVVNGYQPDLSLGDFDPSRKTNSPPFAPPARKR